MSTTVEERRTIMQTIADRVAQGELIVPICKSLGMASSTVWRWCAEDDACRMMYTRAKEQAADALAEEALEVARASTNETAQADRLLVDTLKWAAAKRRPKEYGDKHTVEVSGGVEHLHIDALRSRVSAKATLANINTVNVLDSGSDVNNVDAQELDA